MHADNKSSQDALGASVQTLLVSVMFSAPDCGAMTDGDPGLGRGRNLSALSYKYLYA